MVVSDSDSDSDNDNDIAYVIYDKLPDKNFLAYEIENQITFTTFRIVEKNGNYNQN